MKNYKRFFPLLFFVIVFSGVNAQVTNTSYITTYQEKVLQITTIVPAERAEVWKLFTTDSGLVKWIAPVATINMKTGGWIRTNYNEKGSTDDSTAIQLDIINYLENEMLILKVNLNDNFPAEAINEDENLQEIIQFIDLGNGSTKIISSMVGWGKGSYWDKTYSFFEKGNEWTYKELMKIFFQSNQ